MAYKKPQAPIMNGVDYIYPLTTSDQIVFSDGTRFEKNGVATAQDSELLGGKVPEYYVQPRNLLDNSNFRNPVNQRGAGGSYGSWDGYTIDRWCLSSAETTTISLMNDGMLFKGLLCQVVAEYARLEGKTLTLAVKAGGELYVASGVVKYTNAWNTIAYANKGYLAVISDNTLAFYIESTEEINYEWAALYEGEYTAETLPPYIPKGYAAELAECYRYYYRIGSDTIYSCIATGAVRESNKISCCIEYPVPMRIQPTVTFSGEIMIVPGYVSVSEIYGDVVGKKAASLYVVVDPSATLTIANCYVIVTRNDQNGYVAFSADL